MSPSGKNQMLTSYSTEHIYVNVVHQNV